MRAIITGQVGLDKAEYLDEVLAAALGVGVKPAEVFVANVGEMMYAEDPDIPPGRILDLPLARLRNLRRAVFRDILAAAERYRHVIVNTHATFRWRHGLFFAFDHDLLSAFAAESYLCLVDNIDAIHARLLRDGHVDHSLKDLMVWREEESLTTELISRIVSPAKSKFYIQARGLAGASTAAMTARLLFRDAYKKAYLSFPMTHVMNSPAILAELEDFRRQMKLHFTCFDPGDLEEKYLCDLALGAVAAGRRVVEVDSLGRRLSLDAGELAAIIGDIDGQIYARDFMLIDQADMIISYVPELDGGQVALSSGVERELQHAHETGREVFVIWRPRKNPSPFITETATRVFRSVGEAVEFFTREGYLPAGDAGLFDAVEL